MTIVEKAAYLKGLTEGLGISPDSKEGKLWGALNELLSDMAHEIEDLQASNLDFAEALDDISEDLTYLEELTCDLDMPEDMMDEEDCGGDCSSCLLDCGAADEDEDDEELSYDGVMYEVTCPVCGEECIIIYKQCNDILGCENCITQYDAWEEPACMEEDR